LKLFATFRKQDMETNPAKFLLLYLPNFTMGEMASGQRGRNKFLLIKKIL